MTPQDRMNRFKAKIKKFRLIDDTFMSVVFQNIECTQLLIRAVLENDDLTVTQVDTQNSLKNLQGRSVRLDIIAHDSSGQVYNIEVQRRDSGALPKRARYNSALLDANISEPGEVMEKLPETYVIFITENDYFHMGLPIYHVERVLQEQNKLFDDGAHILYVNGQYRGPKPIGAIMDDFFCDNVEDMKNPILAKEVAKYKETDKGVNHMCRIMEEIAAESRIEGRNEGRIEGRIEGRNEGRLETLLENVKSLLKSGMTLDKIADVLELSDEDRQYIKKNLG